MRQLMWICCISMALWLVAPAATTRAAAVTPRALVGSSPVTFAAAPTAQPGGDEVKVPKDKPKKSKKNDDKDDDPDDGNAGGGNDDKKLPKDGPQKD